MNLKGLQLQNMISCSYNASNYIPLTWQLLHNKYRMFSFMKKALLDEKELWLENVKRL